MNSTPIITVNGERYHHLPELQFTVTYEGHDTRIKVTRFGLLVVPLGAIAAVTQCPTCGHLTPPSRDYYTSWDEVVSDGLLVPLDGIEEDR